MSLVNAGPEVIRVGMGWRVFMTAYGAAFALGGVVGAGLFIANGLWPFALFFLPFVTALAGLCFRTARCRVEIGAEKLVVANQFSTRSLRRGDVVGVDLGRTSNPFGIARTVVLHSANGRSVRIDAASRLGQSDADLAPLVDKLRAWRISG